MTFERRAQSPAPIWIGVLASAFLLAGCGSSEAPNTGDSDATESEIVERDPVNVSAVTIRPETLIERTVLAGRLDPWTEVDVASELGGTVQSVNFEKGRWVEKGQILAKVGTDLLEASLAEVEGELLGAVANFKKTTELFERQAIPRQDLIAATAQHEMSKARVSQAKIRVERSLVRAPSGGIATTRTIELGEVLSPGAPVTRIHQVSRLKATVGVPERDISYFDVGDGAEVAVDAYPDDTFTGKIHFVAPAATANNRTFEVEVALSNRGGKLRPGMIGRVSLIKRVYEDAVVVPRDALLERDTGSVALVLDGDRVRLREVELGPSEGDRIVVIDGLTHGERLVVRGHRGLVDDQPVRLIEDETANSR